MSEILLQCGGRRFQTQSFRFSGGEFQVRIPELPEKLEGCLVTLARIQSPESLIKLLLLNEILDRVHRGNRALVIPYFPYARQDRVMQPDEAFSLKPVARIINMLGYVKVVICDPHSDVTPALLENVRVVPQIDLIAAHGALCDLLHECRPMIVAPDAGAAKKALIVAQKFGMELLSASKVRDTKTGAIVRTELHLTGFIAGGDALIVDDICDGGRTFIELARVLRERGAGRVFLYVTHGIFSQGLGVFDGLIDGIFTTDSFLNQASGAAIDSPVPLYVLNLNHALDEVLP